MLNIAVNYVSRLKKTAIQPALLLKRFIVRSNLEQSSIAAQLPVEIVQQILSWALVWTGPPTPLQGDIYLMSELYDVAWGPKGYDKQLLANVSLVCKRWYAVATAMLFETINVNSEISLRNLLRTLKTKSWRLKEFQISQFTFYLPNHNEQAIFNKHKRSKFIEKLIPILSSYGTSSRVRLNLHMTHSIFYYFAQSPKIDLSMITSLSLVVNRNFHLLSDHPPCWPVGHDKIQLPNLHTLVMHNFIIGEKRFGPATFPALKRLHISLCRFFTSETHENTTANEKADDFAGWSLEYLFLSLVNCESFLTRVLRSSLESLQTLAIATDVDIVVDFTRLLSLRRLLVLDSFFTLNAFSSFPPALQELSIMRDTLVHDTDGQSIRHIMSEAMLRKSMQLPVPALISVECDDVYWTRPFLEDLSDQCDNHGIRLEIYNHPLPFLSKV